MNLNGQGMPGPDLEGVLPAGAVTSPADAATGAVKDLFGKKESNP